ncbi:thioredoxin domain-containing protein [Enterococcus avium]|uniref:thioredoxin domain-containing protein n=1 Tax=Enterococcus avium TaxID=33945 RepID=UPI0028925296|nr:thioredoxin domain-containing protein [Enterococcus avium]MDT2482605.1 thioredoxin domain-containing protein [Enterococcus avium]MDT2509301.1 thioredoxin domain-containing protein [Enterococcus avium]
MKKKNSNKLICFRATLKKMFLFGIFLIIIFVTFFLYTNKGKTTINEQQLNQDIFLQAVVNENANLIFFKDDCPYCSAAEQTIVKTSYKSKYPAFFVDLDTPEGQALKVKYNVKYASTIVIIRKGKSRNELYSTKIQGKYSANRKTIEKALLEKE